MALDNAKNFAKVTISTGYDASATSIVLTTGHGAKLPTAPFNVVWWNASDYGDPSDDPNVEIVRVTAKSTDTLTVTRAQEGTSASTKNTSGKTYKMIAGLTAKVINTDIAALGAMTLLRSASGTTTNASAENVDTVAISGLGANDTLLIIVAEESGQTNNPQLYNVTDGVTIGTFKSSWLDSRLDAMKVRQAQSANTKILSFGETNQSLGTATFTTAWTDSWTLALRHAGVVSGTFRWSWSVYKIAG